MYIEEVDMSVLAPSRISEITKIIDQFLDSPFEIVEIKDHGYKTAAACSAHIRENVARSGKPIKVNTRGDRVFMRKSEEE